MRENQNCIFSAHLNLKFYNTFWLHDQSRQLHDKYAASATYSVGTQGLESTLAQGRRPVLG